MSPLVRMGIAGLSLSSGHSHHFISSGNAGYAVHVDEQTPDLTVPAPPTELGLVADISCDSSCRSTTAQALSPL